MRARQERAVTTDEFMRLPYVDEGPLVREWSVRARTFDAFIRRVMHPSSRRPTRVLDLGAGSGWLSWRLSRQGIFAVAVDCRTDDVDGLAVSLRVRGDGEMFWSIAASFEDLPLPSGAFDLVVFNAALHYALELNKTLAEACRVLRPGGMIAILDSPFYRDEEAGAAMVVEKRRDARVWFGAESELLLGYPISEFLTPARLMAASESLGLSWKRRRVRYPLWYELRPLIARLRGRRAPSRFDWWEGHTI